MSTKSSGFGSETAPYMLRQSFAAGKWSAAEVMPYADLSISPLAKGLHYGQSVFEGMKAYRSVNDEIAVFRPLDHLRRLQDSARRLCMPEISLAEVQCGIEALIAVCHEQVPQRSASLYLRPILFATEGTLSPMPADRFELVVVACPVAAYVDAPQGLRLTTNSQFVRAAPGGTGAAKCAGNYAAPLPAVSAAKAAGFDEVVWLDANERRYLEEAGTMNLFFVRRGKVITPPLSDTILPGLTRDSVLRLAADAGYEVGEECVSVDPREWRDLDEVFTTGTAAGVMSVRELVHEGKTLFERVEGSPVQSDLCQRLEDARFGVCDPYGWRHRVDPDPVLARIDQ